MTPIVGKETKDGQVVSLEFAEIIIITRLPHPLLMETLLLYCFSYPNHHSAFVSLLLFIILSSTLD